MQNMAGRSLISGDEETDQSNSNRHVVGQNEVVKGNYNSKKVLRLEQKF